MIPPGLGLKGKSKFLNPGNSATVVDRTEENEIAKLKDEKIARLEEKVKQLNILAQMQDQLSAWRSKYFTRIVFRLKPSNRQTLDEPAFHVVHQEDGIAK